MDARNVMAGIAAAALAVTGVVVVRDGVDPAAASEFPVIEFASVGIDGVISDVRPRWLLRIDESRLRAYDPSLSDNDRALVDSLLGGDRAELVDPSLVVSQLVTDLPGVEEATRIDDRHVAVVGYVDPVELANTPGVEAVEIDPIVYVTQTDPLMNQLWGLANDGQAIRGNGGSAGADIGWRDTREHDGDGVLVAVIDSGIDLDHPDLRARMWQNPGEICGNGTDDDGNGYVDDCNGWDFARNDGTVDDPGADNFHGTHVAGTIAATADDGVGVAGVAPNVDIMSLKVFDGGGAPSSRSALALRYAVANGADVVNMSLGGQPGGPMPSSMAAAVQEALEAGVVVVAAAGNSGANIDQLPVYPASFHHANVVTVGASDNNDRPASFSNYGARSVELFAPGVDTLSTTPGGGHGWASGTSMAAPHVAGAAALLIAAGTPHLQVKQVLTERSVVVPSLQGRAISSARLHLPTALGGSPPPVVDERGLSGSFTGLAQRVEDEPRTIGIRLGNTDLGNVAEPSLLLSTAYLHGGMFRAVQEHPLSITTPAGQVIDTTTDLEGAVAVPLSSADVDAIVSGEYELTLDLATAAGTWGFMVEVFSEGEPTQDAVIAAADVAAVTAPGVGGGGGGGTSPAPGGGGSTPPPGGGGGSTPPPGGGGGGGGVIVVPPAPAPGGGGGGSIPIVEVDPTPPSGPILPPWTGVPLPGGGGGGGVIIINPVPGGGGSVPAPGGGGGVITIPVPGGGGTTGPAPGGGGGVITVPAPGGGSEPVPSVPAPGGGGTPLPGFDECTPTQSSDRSPAEGDPAPGGDGDVSTPAPGPDDANPEPVEGEDDGGDADDSDDADDRDDSDGDEGEDDDRELMVRPSSGAAGMPVTLHADGFPEVFSVWFGEHRAGQPLVTTPRTLVLLAPHGLQGTVDVRVTDRNGATVLIAEDAYEFRDWRGRRGQTPSAVDELVASVSTCVPGGNVGAPVPGGGGAPPAPGGGDGTPPGGGDDGAPGPGDTGTPRGVLGQPYELGNGLTLDTYTAGHPIGWLASNRVPRCSTDPCDGLTL